MQYCSSTKILINCLLLNQSSGGYRSYFKNVIIPLTNKLNSEGVLTKILMPESVNEEYINLLNTNNLILDLKNKKGYKRIVYEHKLIPKLVEEHGFTKVYTPYQIGPVKVRGAECILMFRNMEPYVASNYKYSLSKRIRSVFLKTFGKYYLNRADKIIVVSQFVKNYIKDVEKIQNNNLAVIPHGIKPIALNNTLIEKDFILSVGSLLPYRRVEDLIKAFNLFKSRNNHKTKLIIVGWGTDSKYIKKITSIINKSNYKADIVLKGKIPHDNVIKLFLSCKIFIMTSEVEACPNTALEAMSFKCPIISSKNQPMPEFFQNTVKYYHRRDVVALANHLESFASNKEMRIEFGKKAFERSKHYTWEKTIDNTIKLLLQNENK